MISDLKICESDRESSWKTNAVETKIWKKTMSLFWVSVYGKLTDKNLVLRRTTLQKTIIKSLSLTRVKYRSDALYVSYSLQIPVKGMNGEGSTQTRKMKTCPYLTNDIVVHTPTCP
ncbi:hypothetical protein V8G54_015430 [Vigna mungo]|uniref:Uncharacterized protein n=1 Tax=Vigna mungo TaxID=3915 RepID=A0AAQ3NL49_VIGMU